MTRKEMLVVRIDPELKRRLEELAARDQRTLSSLVGKLLATSVEGYGQVVAGWAYSHARLREFSPRRKPQK